MNMKPYTDFKMSLSQEFEMTLKCQIQGHVYISVNMHFRAIVSMEHEYETLYRLSNEPIPVPLR
jgi:hypothetical protein